LGDIYEPRARATALGWFLSGTLIAGRLGASAVPMLNAKNKNALTRKTYFQLAGTPIWTYNTTGSVINASNALYMAFMGIAAPFWGPFSQVWGWRR
jgi:hypothetical protein